MNRTIEDILMYSLIGAVGGIVIFTKLDGAVFEFQEKLPLFNDVALKTGALKYGALCGAMAVDIMYGIGRVIENYRKEK
ncbi:MAG TPA: hypothetical protein VJI32_03255 [Candidatus Nanoarchaeia archaeon]|nr:hypothetical protein [Candidatus Nanoarchaeia archaeon]